MDTTPSRDRHADLERELRLLYGDAAGATLERALALVSRHREAHPGPSVPPVERLSERDAVVIAYGDHVRAPGEPPLRTLRRLLEGPLAGVGNGVHLLPIYPWTSDDGFSVVDHRAVDPELGTWEDVEAIAASRRLMLDAVINHASASSAWVRGFLAGDPAFAGFVKTADPDADLSMVVRPRTTPLLTPAERADGSTVHLWTTFGPDQVDLDYGEPRVFLEVLDVLLGYVAHGAEILRLDAVTYLWKEPGHPSVHHPKTHAALRALRAALELAAPRVVVLTETNVPHAENVSYFGDGTDEAQMVYGFALPPLVLHAFLTGDARALSRWAATLSTPTPETTFFSFLASHDGIGVRPVEEILAPDAFAALVASARERGGRVSSKRDPDGGESPYELNVNLWDALQPPDGPEDLERDVRRFATAHAIAFALPGVPGVYLHSLLGSRGAPAEVERTGRARSINREKLDMAALEADLADPGHRRARVLAALRRLLGARAARPAFAPSAPFRVLDAGPHVLAITRGEGEGRVWCLHNVSGAEAAVPPGVLPDGPLRDAVTGDHPGRSGGLRLRAFETRWLEEA